MSTPNLSSIRIRYSETSEIHEGQQFHAIADFDATMRAACFTAPSDGCYFKVAFVVTWSDGGTFEGRIDLERHEYGGLSAHIVELCTYVESSPALAHLVTVARVTRARVLHAAAQERMTAGDARIAELTRQLAEIRQQVAKESN